MMGSSNTEDHRYKLSFTATALGLTESVKVADVFLNCHDWETTRELVDQENILQSRTNTRNTRVAWEIIQRLSKLNDQQLQLLVEGSLEEQRLLLWFAVCNFYAIIKEFAIEVVHEKFRLMDLSLTDEDYYNFVVRKLDWHPELSEITHNTRAKLRSVLFHMMREAGLLSEENTLLRVIPTARLAQSLQSHADFAFQIYPAFPSEFEV